MTWALVKRRAERRIKGAFVSTRKCSRYVYQDIEGTGERKKLKEKESKKELVT